MLFGKNPFFVNNYKPSPFQTPNRKVQIPYINIFEHYQKQLKQFIHIQATKNKLA